MKPTDKEIMAAIKAGQPPRLKKVPAWIREAVIAIEQDLDDRRGLGHEWRQVDEEIKREIRQCWAALIARAAP